MKFCVYKDGYSHRADNYLSASEIKADEQRHGELIMMKSPDGIVVCDYNENGGRLKR